VLMCQQSGLIRLVIVLVVVWVLDSPETFGF
jgi:hypothetical protein